MDNLANLIVHHRRRPHGHLLILKPLQLHHLCHLHINKFLHTNLTYQCFPEVKLIKYWPSHGKNNLILSPLHIIGTVH